VKKLVEMKEEKVKCPNCDINMKTDTIPMTFKVNPNVIVQSVEHHTCPKCGFDLVTGKEYERVRKLVHGASKIKAKIVVL